MPISDSGSVPKLQFNMTHSSGISLFSFHALKTWIPYELWASAGSPVDVRLPDSRVLMFAGLKRLANSLCKPGTRATTTNATHATPTRHDACTAKGKFVKTCIHLYSFIYNKQRVKHFTRGNAWKLLD